MDVVEAVLTLNFTDPIHLEVIKSKSAIVNVFKKGKPVTKDINLVNFIGTYEYADAACKEPDILS